MIIARGKMTPQNLLIAWMRIYGPIPEALRHKFIARSEVNTIVGFCDTDIVANIRRHKLLAEILKSLEADAKRKTTSMPGSGGAIKPKKPKPTKKSLSPFKNKSARYRPLSAETQQPSGLNPKPSWSVWVSQTNRRTQPTTSTS